MFIQPEFHLGVRVGAYGLPAYGQRAIISAMRVYIEYEIRFGPCPLCVRIPIRFDLLNESALSPPNTLPYETLPGGTTNLDHESGGCGTSAFPASLFLNTELYNGDICFVPTYSALDVATVTPATAFAKYINNATDNPSAPRVMSYIAQPNPGSSATEYNLNHLTFTPRNSEWIFNEMERPFNGNTNSVACDVSNECNPITITTSAYHGSVCAGTNITFTANHVPANAMVTWLSQNGTVGTGNGLTFVTAPDGTSGQLVVYATIVTAQGCSITQISSVLAGPPPQSSEPICGTYSYYNSNSFSTAPIPGATSYRWTEHNDLRAMQVQFTGSSPTYSLTTMGIYEWPNTIELTVEPINDCGIGPPVQATLQIDFNGNGSLCMGGRQANQMMATLYPNPAKETVDVHLDNASAATPVTVRLFDSYGRACTEQVSRGEATLRLRTEKLPAGLYFVHILRGKEVLSRQQLRIEK